MDGPQLVDTMFLRVAKVCTFAGDAQLTNATGFFYLHDNFLYLITARHVVVNERVNHRPDSLHVWLHSNIEDLRQSVDLSIPLYVDGVPQWWEHPKYRGNVDVVAVAINEPDALSRHFVNTFSASDTADINQVLPLGQDVLIIGFPLGFYDTVHNLPVVRRATIASSFSHPFKGEPYFLTDARMHRGTSGAPVIAQVAPGIEPASSEPPVWRLLGIHTSALDVSNRESDKDERLALNTTWYASLIMEMLPRRRS